MSLKIGLTGGIGSGKTTVAKIFELLEVPVYYADDAARRLYKTDKALIEKMKQHFGNDIYTNDDLDRSKLAAIVFSDLGKLQFLNNLVHPLTINDAATWMSQQTAPYTVKEAALLFESGANASLDFVIGVNAPLPIRLQRVIERDQSSAEEVMKRMYGQMGEDEKMNLCDFVITNDEQDLVLPQVLQLHNKLTEMASARVLH